MRLKKSLLYLTLSSLIFYGVAFADSMSLEKFRGSSTTSKYELLWNDWTSDQNAYQYLNLNMDSIDTEKFGSYSGALYLRVGADIDGEPDPWGDDSYYTYRDLMDVETDDGAVARFYYGYIDVTDVIPITDLRIGRQYLNRGQWLQFDGGTFNINILDNLDVIVFGGGPTSFFYDVVSDWVYGIGVDYKPWEKTKISLDYMRQDVDDFNDDIGSINISHEILKDWDASIYASSVEDNVKDMKINTSYNWRDIDTLVNVYYKRIFNAIEEYAYPLGTYEYALGDTLPSNSGDLSLTNFSVDNLISKVGVSGNQISNVDDESYTNISYVKSYLSLTYAGFPFETSQITLEGDYWRTNRTNENDDTAITGNVDYSQIVLENVSLLLGTAYSKYDYIFHENTGDQIEEDVRRYYVSLDYTPREWLSITGDFDVEDSGNSDESPFYTLTGYVKMSF